MLPPWRRPPGPCVRPPASASRRGPATPSSSGHRRRNGWPTLCPPPSPPAVRPADCGPRSIRCGSDNGRSPSRPVVSPAMATFPIRVFGDLGLKQRCPDVTEFDGALARLADDMIETMYAAPGVGLAANQIGIQKRIFVYDAGDGPFTVVNPTIVETSESWEYEEGCLSVPGLYFPIVRPRCATLKGYDLDAKEFTREGQDLLGPFFYHDPDHLEGSLPLTRPDTDPRRGPITSLRSGGPRGTSHRRGPPAAGGPPPKPE